MPVTTVSTLRSSCSFMSLVSSNVPQRMPCKTLLESSLIIWYLRYLFRQLSRRSKLYTEMYVDSTILHQQDNLWQYLGHNPADGPLAVQLGGNDPAGLAEVAKICEEWSFDEINLNCGCPSTKVSDRCFGARLMLVRFCVLPFYPDEASYHLVPLFSTGCASCTVRQPTFRSSSLALCGVVHYQLLLLCCRSWILGFKHTMRWS